MNVLLFEDQLELAHQLRSELADYGYRVTWVRQLTSALSQLEGGGIDLVLLDLGLADDAGHSLLQRMRRDWPRTPVLNLTTLDLLGDSRLFGADGNAAHDFLLKPFAPAELRARLRALGCRSFGADTECLDLRGLSLNLGAQRASLNGRPLELSRSEYLLLSALATRADRVQTRRVLEEQIGSSVVGRASNVLDVQISNLRKKLGEGYVRTVRNVGYVIDRRTEPRGQPS
ncbi:response regulator transcription factor [Roseateles oligotrophus]|uniref:Response regulator transcription factor n=1 Tax=Roseateles oligotrophus TaxID=1769250 RepID=A0ABT2YLX0_9BURK|nr:response regulator transcription factor [Roseateles oligotrophus]MCV2371073.1 response regulator transcription factor [Roseateles oligotrophus]